MGFVLLAVFRAGIVLNGAYARRLGHIDIANNYTFNVFPLPDYYYGVWCGGNGTSATRLLAVSSPNKGIITTLYSHRSRLHTTTSPWHVRCGHHCYGLLYRNGLPLHGNEGMLWACDRFTPVL